MELNEGGTDKISHEEDEDHPHADNWSWHEDEDVNDGIYDDEFHLSCWRAEMKMMKWRWWQNEKGWRNKDEIDHEGKKLTFQDRISEL